MENTRFQRLSLKTGASWSPPPPPPARFSIPNWTSGNWDHHLNHITCPVSVRTLSGVCVHTLPGVCVLYARYLVSVSVHCLVSVCCTYAAWCLCTYAAWCLCTYAAWCLCTYAAWCLCAVRTLPGVCVLYVRCLVFACCTLFAPLGPKVQFSSVPDRTYCREKPILLHAVSQVFPTLRSKIGTATTANNNNHATPTKQH